MLRNPMLLVIAAASLASGCDTPRQESSQAPSYGQIREAELEAERQEFLAESRQRMAEVDKEIRHLQAKLEHESEFVDVEQRAKWSQHLFEEQQEHSRLAAEIDRAETATLEEWAEMRNPMGLALDEMEAAMRKVGAEMREGSSRKEAPIAGLCALDVEGARTQVYRDKGAVVVLATSTQQAAVEDLQERGKKMSRLDRYTPARAPTMEPVGSMDVSIDADDVENGVRLSLVPEDGAQLEQLYAQVSRDAAQMGDPGACPAPPEPTSRR